MGPQQTRSLSGDECWDLQCHARITTQKITRLPIFPPDDRFPCCTEQRGLAINHVSKGPGRRIRSLPGSEFRPCPPHASFSHLQSSVQSQTLVKSGISSDGRDSWVYSHSNLPNIKPSICNARLSTKSLQQFKNRPAWQGSWYSTSEPSFNNAKKTSAFRGCLLPSAKRTATQGSPSIQKATPEGHRQQSCCQGTSPPECCQALAGKGTAAASLTQHREQSKPNHSTHA